MDILNEAMSLAKLLGSSDIEWAFVGAPRGLYCRSQGVRCL